MAEALHCDSFDLFDGGRSQATMFGQGPGTISEALGGSYRSYVAACRWRATRDQLKGM